MLRRISGQLALAQFFNGAVGVGAGGSAAIGKLVGVAFTISRQLVAYPNGEAAFVTTYTQLPPTHFPAVVSVGAGAFAGVQFSVSSAQSPADSVGTAVTYGEAAGARPGLRRKTFSVSSGSANQPVVQSTAAIGIGVGGFSYGGQFTTSDASLICRE